MDVMEIAEIKAMIVCSLDRSFVVWDLVKFEKRFKMTIDGRPSAHTFKFSETHQLLFSAHYHELIEVYKFDSYMEMSCIKKLDGHKSKVNAIELLKDTYYLLSGDDTCEI
jgi:WD40 repeat protein